MDNNIVENLLDQIKDRYPTERMQATKQRLQALWDNQTSTNRMSYVLYAMPLKQSPKLSDDMSGIERELITQLQAILEHATWSDDYVPGLSPGINQAMLPAYFGCTEETSPMTSRIIPVIHSPSDVYDLQEIGFGSETLAGKMLEKMSYFYNETQGMLPIYEADLQGPFSVASQVWGIENFLMAVYEYPDEVHHLLSLCTDVVIKFAKLMRDVVNNDWIPYHCAPAVWIPPEKGIAYSEDLLAVVSPKIVSEFISPYCERIASEFGVALLHSCGSINHIIDELNQVDGLVGLNFASSETDLPLLAEYADDSLVLTVHNSPVSCNGLPIPNAIEHIKLCKSVFRQSHAKILCQVFGGIDMTPLAVEQLITSSNN
jgi:hypothetical protein